MKKPRYPTSKSPRLTKKSDPHGKSTQREETTQFFFPPLQPPPPKKKYWISASTLNIVCNTLPESEQHALCIDVYANSFGTPHKKIGVLTSHPPPNIWISTSTWSIVCHTFLESQKIFSYVNTCTNEVGAPQKNISEFQTTSPPHQKKWYIYVSPKIFSNEKA